MKKIIYIFALINSTYHFGLPISAEIKDNTPPMLAAMQHTWEVFPFYTNSKSQFAYENI